MFIQKYAPSMAQASTPETGARDGGERTLGRTHITVQVPVRDTGVLVGESVTAIGGEKRLT